MSQPARRAEVKNIFGVSPKKILPRHQCSVCGEYHTPLNQFQEERLIQALGLNMQPQIGVLTRFSQCAECVKKHGTLIEMQNRSNKYSRGRFSLNTRTWVELKGTGPSDD